MSHKSWAITFMIIGIFNGGMSVFNNHMTHVREREAVERGYAEWVVGAAGTATWRWKEKTP